MQEKFIQVSTNKPSIDLLIPEIAVRIVRKSSQITSFCDAL